MIRADLRNILSLYSDYLMFDDVIIGFISHKSSLPRIRMVF